MIDFVGLAYRTLGDRKSEIYRSGQQERNRGRIFWKLRQSSIFPGKLGFCYAKLQLNRWHVQTLWWVLFQLGVKWRWMQMLITSIHCIYWTLRTNICVPVKLIHNINPHGMDPLYYPRYSRKLWYTSWPSPVDVIVPMLKPHFFFVKAGLLNTACVWATREAEPNFARKTEPRRVSAPRGLDAYSQTFWHTL